MRFTGSSRALLLALALSLSASASDPSFAFDVEEWQTIWLDYSDDFQDGAFWDDNPSTEPTHYFVGCGSIDDEDEDDGRLRLQGATCVNAASAFAAASETTVRATFRFAVPSPNAGYGVFVSNYGTDRVTLSLDRYTQPPPEPADALIALLSAEPEETPEADMIPVKWALISDNPDGDPSLDVIQAIELKLQFDLQLAPDPRNSVLIPTGSYRLCSESPCEDEAEFQPIEAPPPPPYEIPDDEGALATRDAHGAMLVGFSRDGSSFAFDVEEWSQTASAFDDFEDGVFPGHLPPYYFTCGDPTKVVEANGKLTLLGPNAPCNGLGFGAGGSQPGKLLTRAKYVFEIPDRCEGYGIALGNDTGVFPPDFVTLMLWRSQYLDEPDVLAVTLHSEPEAGGPAWPIVARALVSTDPDDDPALAEVEAIELELALERSAPGEPLVPTPRFRLCTASGCPPEFSLLDPHVPAPDPDAMVCGLPASLLDPPGDQGVVNSLEYLGPGLFVTSIPVETLTIDLDPGIVNGFGAEDIAVNPATNQIYIANSDSASVSVVDGSTDTFLKNIAVGLDPSIVDVNTLTDKVYVVNEDDHTVSVIDGSTNAVEATITGVGGGGHQLNMAINRPEKLVYVANMSDGSVSVIDADPTSEHFNSVIDRIDSGFLDWGVLFLAVNEATNTLYILDRGRWWDHAKLAVIDGVDDPIVPLPDVRSAETLVVNQHTNYLYVGHDDGIAIIDGFTNTVVPSPPDCCYEVEYMAVNESVDLIYATDDGSPLVLDGDPDSQSFHEIVGRGVGLGHEGIAINENTDRVYVVGSWGGLMVYDAALTPPPAIFSTGGTAYDLAFDGVNDRVWVAHSSTEGIKRIDTATNSLVTAPSLDLQSGGPSVLFNPNTNRLYAQAVTIDPLTESIKVIDLTTLDVEANIPVGLPYDRDGWEMNLRTNRLYVIDGDQVHVIEGDPASGDFNTVIADITVGGDAEGIAIDESTNLIYVLVEVDTGDDTPSEVCVIDGDSNTVVPNPIRVGEDAEAIAVNQTTFVIDGFSVIETISLDADPEEMLVNEKTNRLYVEVDGDMGIVVINCENHIIEDAISLLLDESDLEFALDSSLDYIYAADEELGAVYVIDGDPDSPRFNTIEETLAVGRSPESIVVDPTTHRVYVANAGDDTVSVIIKDDMDGDLLLDGVEIDTGTDPLDPDTDDDGLGDGAEVALGTDPLDPDTDDDGVCDGGNAVPADGGPCTEGPDNCPFNSDPDQTNSDTLPAGDVCQCGDVNGENGLTELDLTIARQHLVGATLSGNVFIPERCNVIGPSDGGASDCDVADIYVLERLLAGGSAKVENSCQAYTGP
jgi:YVTN family beta-propeller protein